MLDDDRIIKDRGDEYNYPTKTIIHDEFSGLLYDTTITSLTDISIQHSMTAMHQSHADWSVHLYDTITLAEDH